MAKKFKVPVGLFDNLKPLSDENIGSGLEFVVIDETGRAIAIHERPVAYIALVASGEFDALRDIKDSAIPFETSQTHEPAALAAILGYITAARQNIRLMPLTSYPEVRFERLMQDFGIINQVTGRQPPDLVSHDVFTAIAQWENHTQVMKATERYVRTTNIVPPPEIADLLCEAVITPQEGTSIKRVGRLNTCLQMGRTDEEVRVYVEARVELLYGPKQSLAGNLAITAREQPEEFSSGMVGLAEQIQKDFDWVESFPEDRARVFARYLIAAAETRLPLPGRIVELLPVLVIKCAATRYKGPPSADTALEKVVRAGSYSPDGDALIKCSIAAQDAYRDLTTQLQVVDRTRYPATMPTHLLLAGQSFTAIERARQAMGAKLTPSAEGYLEEGRRISKAIHVPDRSLRRV